MTSEIMRTEGMPWWAKVGVYYGPAGFVVVCMFFGWMWVVQPELKIAREDAGKNQATAADLSRSLGAVERISSTQERTTILQNEMTKRMEEALVRDRRP
jgi:hypothetical protein